MRLTPCEEKTIREWATTPDQHYGFRYRFNHDWIAKLLAELDAVRSRYSWQPISEIHEDYGPCVLVNVDDPGHMEIGSNLDVDFDESQWTHFVPVPALGQEEDYERMNKENTPAGFGIERQQG